MVDQLAGAALKVTVFASVSLACMIGDFLWLIRDEVECVWPRLRTSWTPRIFVFTRYVGLASQIFNVYFTARMYLGVHTSNIGCRLWFSFQAVVVQFLLFFLQALLMYRIYALFLQTRVVLIVLVVLFLAQIASMGISARFVFPTNRHTDTCLIVRSNPSVALFSATTMIVNAAAFIMTFWRYLRLPAKWTREGFGRVILRDSAVSLAVLSGMMLFLTLCSLEVIKPLTTGNTTYYPLVAILWISIGRIIVNHEKVQHQTGRKSDAEFWKETLQLTTQFELGEAVSVDLPPTVPGS